MIKFNELDDKQKFLLREIITMSINGGLQHSTTYNKTTTADSQERKDLKKSISDFLISEIICKTNFTEEEIIKLIVKLSETLSKSKKHTKILNDGKFRIGISQKIINLFLKYIWTLVWFKDVPPLCPIDKTILNKIRRYNENWTRCNDINKYKEWIDEIKKEAKKEHKSIAEWELFFFNTANY